MLHNPFSNATQTRQIANSPGTTTSRLNATSDIFSDARLHGYQGPSRAVLLPNAASPGGSAICKSQDGECCVVAGRESLRILRVCEVSEMSLLGATGHFRVDASKNFWTGSGLKVDNPLTDVVWCQKAFDTKVLTGTRSGELILWDVHKANTSRYERRIKGHTRAINKLSYSPFTPHYCSTGSSDGNLRIWDLRDLSKATHSIHHSSSIRTVMFSPSIETSFHVTTGLDNGTICRWDLRMGQKGQLERVPLAHSDTILSFDWFSQGGLFSGWLASAGLDRTVKVWDFTDPNFTQAHSVSRKPKYVLHPSYPVRRVAWRPGYEMELALASNIECGFDFTSKASPSSSPMLSTRSLRDSSESANEVSNARKGNAEFVPAVTKGRESCPYASNVGPVAGDAIEIWDVRREWVAKWIANGSTYEGGVSDLTFADSHALWVQHPSGAFSQMDLRFCERVTDSIPRSALTWTPAGSLTFADDSISRWEVPYDDMLSTQCLLNEKSGMMFTGSFSDPTLNACAAPESSVPHKKLGDAPYVGTSQAVGTLLGIAETEDWEVFAYLADNYKIEGADKATLCTMNADVAFNAGNEDAGRIWLLLRICLTDTNMRESTMLKVAPPALLHSMSSPALISASKLPHKQSSSGSPSPERSTASINTVNSPAKSSRSQAHSSAFPDASNIVPGHNQTGGIAGRGASQSPHSIKRQSIHASPLSRSRSSIVRRASAASGRQYERSSTSSSRLHLIGEGALDDSDSSSSYGRLELDNRREGLQKNSVEELKRSVTRKRFETSPLVHEDHDWAEDEKEEGEDEDDSVSPASSSEDESDNSVASTTAAQLSSRSRSTRASAQRPSALAAPSASVIQSVRRHDGKKSEIQRTESQSSVLTVIAGGGSGYALQDSSIGFASPSATNDGNISKVSGPADRSSLAHSSLLDRRRRSQILPVNNMQPIDADEEYGPDKHEHFVQWNHVAIKDTERQYRQALWRSLQGILDELADNGDIQMCAMLACIAPTELAIQPSRALQFLESYIDMLSRLRLHAACAYIRKFSDCTTVQETTQVQTTIYAMCAKCRKPLVQPVARHGLGHGRTWNGYSYCLKCKAPTVNCAICHLPVRSALFLCAVCSHGGHHDCYRRYYTQRPMVELANLRADYERGRSPSRHERRSASWVSSEFYSAPTGLDSAPGAPFVRVMGHPCVTGCGHFCWTANEKSFT